MNNNIKINRAKKISKKLPMASNEIWSSIPSALIEQLTSQQLALVANTLDAHWHKAVKHANEETVAEGYVWSSKHNALLDVKVASQNG